MLINLLIAHLNSTAKKIESQDSLFLNFWERLIFFYYKNKNNNNNNNFLLSIQMFLLLKKIM